MSVLSPALPEKLSRRALLIGAPLALAGCAGGRMSSLNPVDFGIGTLGPADLRRYDTVVDNGHTIPALDMTRVEQRWLRQTVAYDGSDAPGTIVVDPGERHLYLVQPGHRAIRYGVGVGREGFGWAGQARIGGKAVWPTWTPPKEMQARDAEARKYAGGMPGGIDNPLGARAMYLYQGDRDTLFRIHGTAEPYSIGTKVSSGCIRMFNHDVADLFDRVGTGTKVIVLPTNLL